MSIRENIHNYYEKMVTDVLADNYSHKYTDLDDLVDIACVALNHLPPRYFRHEIDMAFYLSPTEHAEMDEKVKNAIEDAIEYIEKNRTVVE